MPCCNFEGCEGFKDYLVVGWGNAKQVRSVAAEAACGGPPPANQTKRALVPQPCSCLKVLLTDGFLVCLHVRNFECCIREDSQAFPVSSMPSTLSLSDISTDCVLQGHVAFRVCSQDRSQSDQPQASSRRELQRTLSKYNLSLLSCSFTKLAIMQLQFEKTQNA